MAEVVLDDATKNFQSEQFICYSSYDQLSLNVRHWPVINEEPRAVVLIVHGSGEHCERYEHVARFFNEHQLASVSYDLRGHGYSGGERGYFPCIDAVLDDLECVIRFIRVELYPDISLIIYSHGTGSAFCLMYDIRRPENPLDCQAMIVSTPSICLKKRPSRIQLFLMRAFANLNPHLRLPIDGNRTNVYTNDPIVVQAYRNDDRIHGRWPAATIAILVEIGLFFEKKTFTATCPMLIQHGSADTTTPVTRIRK
ncbi:unnamed protein product [Rotaria socialis]|uniref:Serine aminopeptidase S33 domain-containing protein n=1 Tax=Rotaria socialis TaxID=392032 RepID=A0A820Y2A7_9BILA|nr:unnamed protein product [Rotaria socialis]CAF4542208.1 unnamed protein product [Rotaria socialis]